MDYTVLFPSHPPIKENICFLNGAALGNECFLSNGILLEKIIMNASLCSRFQFPVDVLSPALCRFLPDEG